MYYNYNKLVSRAQHYRNLLYFHCFIQCGEIVSLPHNYYTLQSHAIEHEIAVNKQ